MVIRWSLWMQIPLSAKQFLCMKKKRVFEIITNITEIGGFAIILSFKREKRDSRETGWRTLFSLWTWKQTSFLYYKGSPSLYFCRVTSSHRRKEQTNESSSSRWIISHNTVTAQNWIHQWESMDGSQLNLISVARILRSLEIESTSSRLPHKIKS